MTERHVKLVVVGGDYEASELILKLPAVIGRSRESAVVLSHPLVSRHHCELFSDDGQVRVRDLGSLNGTFVGSQQITESVLRAGDLLTVGTVTFRLVAERVDEPDSGSPTAKPSGRQDLAAADTVRGSSEGGDETLRLTHRSGARRSIEAIETSDVPHTAPDLDAADSDET